MPGSDPPPTDGADVHDITTGRKINPAARQRTTGRPTKAALALRDGEIMRYLLAGATYAQIAERLQMSPDGARSACRRILRTRATQDQVNTDEYFALVNARLEALWQTAFRSALGGDMAAVVACERLLTRMCRLHGIDQAPAVDVHVTVEAPAEVAARRERLLEALGSVRAQPVIDGEVVG